MRACCIWNVLPNSFSECLKVTAITHQALAHDVAIGNHADQAVVLPYRNGAYIAVTHQFCEFSDRSSGVDPIDAFVHDLFDFHSGPPFFLLNRKVRRLLALEP